MKEISRAKLILSRLLSFFIKVTSPYFLWKPQIVIRMYETCLFQRIMKEHMPLTLEGINLGLDINGWKVCFLQENDRKKSIFNGGGDHLIFEISEKTYYYTASDSNGNPIELMDCEEHINGGVFWYHLKGLKYPEQCTLFDFSILKNQTLDKSLYLFYPVFFSYEKECLPDPEDLLSEIKEKING